MFVLVQITGHPVGIVQPNTCKSEGFHREEERRLRRELNKYRVFRRIEIYHWNDFGTCQLRRQMFPTPTINYERWRCQFSIHQNTKLRNVALYCPLLHCITLYCTVLYCTALYHTLLHHIALHCIVSHYIALHFLHCNTLQLFLHHNSPYINCFVLLCLLLLQSVEGLFLKHGFNEAGFDSEFNLFASNHICPSF